MLLSVGVLTPVGVGIACVLAFIIYSIQTSWYGDNNKDARTKALIVGLLTAIPVPIAIRAGSSFSLACFIPSMRDRVTCAA